MTQQPQDIAIAHYDYPLPDERIAKYPVTPRHNSKLLLWRGGRLWHETFRNLPQHLPQGALLIYNNTRVIRARLRFRKATGALIEIFCLEPHTPSDYAQNFASTATTTWYCLVGNAKKWKNNEPLTLMLDCAGKPITLSAQRGETIGTSTLVTFTWSGGVSWAEAIEAAGELPIPPYLHRDTEASDLDTYQTVYAKIKGSVAAPTAGLHFTDEVFADLDERGIKREEITLHVGAGTFKPVKAQHIGSHEMHAEWIAVSRHTIAQLIAHGGQCVAVGTTSVRTLESLYYIGCKVDKDPTCDEAALAVQQWEAYAPTANTLTTLQALEALAHYMDTHGLDVLYTSTQIIIAPGYNFHIVSQMITNFHQPKSTLLLLVSAFLGGHWRTLYDYALANDFRFLSYGDSSLLTRHTSAPTNPQTASGSA